MMVAIRTLLVSVSPAPAWYAGHLTAQSRQPSEWAEATTDERTTPVCALTSP